jgi:hypothetical protein
VYVLINWSRACSRSVYLRIQEIKSILNVLYHNQSNGSKCVIGVCRTCPTFEKTDLGHVRQQSVTWEKVFKRQRSFFSFFLLKLKILEAKVKFWCGTHMTQLFLKKFLIFTKILEESEWFFILFLKKMEIWGGFSAFWKYEAAIKKQNTFWKKWSERIQRTQT